MLISQLAMIRQGVGEIAHLLGRGGISLSFYMFICWYLHPSIEPIGTYWNLSNLSNLIYRCIYRIYIIYLIYLMYLIYLIYPIYPIYLIYQIDLIYLIYQNNLSVYLSACCLSVCLSISPGAQKEEDERFDCDLLCTLRSTRRTQQQALHIRH